MKKILTFSVSAVLAVSMLAFSACGKDETSVGVVKGNYKEATAEEIQTALNGIDTDKAFGDTEADDYKFGIEFLAEVEGAVSVGEATSVSANASAGYQIVLQRSEGALGFTGKGEVAVEANIIDEGESESLGYNVTAYNDSDYIYVSANDTVNNQSEKVKINLGDVMEEVLDLLPDLSGETLPVPPVNDYVPYPDLSDISDIQSYLSMLNLKTYLDTSDGVKIKISADEDTFGAIIDLALGQIPAISYNPAISSKIDEVLSTLNFTASKFDLYLAFEANGLFSQYGVDVDLAFTVDTSALSDIGFDAPGLIGVSLSGGVALKAYSGTVVLPEGISNDSGYVEYDLDDVSYIF